jgi:HD-GYP domain-containing protein (c-di-GMP phosphodiesterase class II)
MRRVAVENAEIGMILTRAVYSAGTLVLDSGTRLDAIHLPVLSRLEVQDLIIEDERVADVIIIPLISEELEAQAIRLLHRVLDGNRDKDAESVKLDFVSLDRLVKNIVSGFHNSFLGEISIEICKSRGNYDYVQPVKTAGLALCIGKEAGLSRPDMINLVLASLLQNIGYVLLPRQLLKQLDPDTEEDDRQFRKHPAGGAEILEYQQNIPDRVVEAVRHHHEKWNGGGFPGGLKGEEISELARIITITDAFYSLISSRGSRSPYPLPEAAEYIAAYSGEYFDPKLAQIFVRNIPLYSKGISVKLNSGETGIIIDANTGYIGRPTMRICYDQRGNEIKPYDLDLTEARNQSVMVRSIVNC